MSSAAEMRREMRTENWSSALQAEGDGWLLQERKAGGKKSN